MILRMVLLLSLVLCFTPLAAQEMVDSRSALTSVQSAFVQEKHLPILARPIISKGRFIFQAPASLRWEYFSPLPSVLLMDGGRTRKFVSHDGVFQEEHGMGVDSMAVVLQEISGWLDGRITDTPTFRAESVGENRIVLTPKEEALRQIISRIELKLVDSSGLMESVTIYEGKDSFTRMVFSDAVINGKIAAGVFQKP